MILSRIFVWLVSLPLDPFAFSFKVFCGASFSITPSIKLSPVSTRFLNRSSKNRVIKGNLHQVPQHQTVRTAAVDLLIKEIDTWIMEMRTYAIKFRTSPCSRKATVLMVKHRAANLTYRSTIYTDKIWPQLLYGDHAICQSRPVILLLFIV